MSLEGAGQLGLRFKAIERETVGLPPKLGLAVVAEAKRLVPRKTGNLGRRIMVARSSPTTVEVVARTPYAAAVELGSKPHDIVPKRRKVLRFPAKGTPTTLAGRARSGGTYAFAKRVRHPGTKAQPYLVPGARKALGRFGLADDIVVAWNRAA